jgi:polysaccharide export outer membrane protein
MQRLYHSLLGVLLFASGIAGQTDLASIGTPTPPRPTQGVQSDNPQTNLPWLPVGPGDLLGVTVMDCPELSRAFRVADDGSVTLPLLQNKLHVAGLKPPEIEALIASATKEQHLLVRPSVSVAIMEFRSRPINVVGAVNLPTQFQASAGTTLLDALSQARGMTREAGPEIVVTSSQVGPDGIPTPLTRRIPVHALLHDTDPSLNIPLVGGEEVRVPEADKIYVVGNVKIPSALPVHDDMETSVLRVLAQCQGLTSFPTNQAYVYRLKPGTKEREEIVIPLHNIVKRTAPDVALFANDVLYIPDATGKRVTITIIEKLAEIGGSTLSGMAVWGRL